MSRMSGEQRRPQIAQAALKIIAEHGASGFTTRALAQEVGLAEGTIFRHFDTKEDIIRAAIEHLEEILAEDLTTSESDDPVERLGRFFRRRLEIIQAHPGIVRILFSNELAHVGTARDAERIQVVKLRVREFITARIQEAAEAGALRPGVSPEILPIIIHGTAMAMLFGVIDTDRPSGPEHAAALWNTLATLL
ncbi:MAG: TetR/AcrR family transcriptional regulator, partial [Deltaproteobacteria bacterium]|nr:TetR/AcrR family transcriptional regulator [Deltaproteobacteria bacterium]